MYDLIRYSTLAFALLFGVPVGTLLAARFRFLRDAAFVLAVFGTCIADTIDVNVMNIEWYRGTSWGIGVSFIDILLLIVLFATLVSRQEPLYWPAGLLPMLLFLLWCTLNVATAEPKILGVFELAKVARGILVFLAAAYFIRSEREVRLVLMAIAAALTYQGFLCLRSRYWYGIVRAYGSLRHPNMLADYCALTVPILVSCCYAHIPQRLRYVLMFGAAMGTGCAILTVSRMGILATVFISGAAAALGAIVNLTPRRIVAAGLVSVLLLLALAKSADTLRQRYVWRAVQLELESPDYEGRGVHWKMTKLIVRDRPISGVGLNNWSYWTAAKYGRMVGAPYIPYGEKNFEHRGAGAPAHSIYMLTVGELGLPGLVFFLVMVGRWLMGGFSLMLRRSDNVMRRFGIGVGLAVLGLLLSNITEWSLRMGHIYLMLHILVGALAAVQYRLKSGRDLNVRRGVRSAPQARGNPRFATSTG